MTAKVTRVTVEIYRGYRIERRQPESKRRGARNWRCDVPGVPANSPSFAAKYNLAGCKNFIGRRLAYLAAKAREAEDG